MKDDLPKNGRGVRGLFRYDREKKKLVRIGEPRKLDVAAPNVHIDSIDPTVSHASTEGAVFTSKKKLREHYKANNCIETGGERAKRERPDPEKRYREIREDVEKSMNDIRWGNVPMDEKEREQCLKEEREWNQYRKRQA